LNLINTDVTTAHGAPSLYSRGALGLTRESLLFRIYG